MILSRAFIGTDSSGVITSAPYNSAPTVRQGSEHYTRLHCIMLFPYGIWRGQSLQSVLVFNFTNMHAMSYWSDFFPCSCRVNIYEPAVGITVLLFLPVSRVVIPSILISTAMSDTESLNTLSLQDMISSNNDCVFISDFQRQYIANDPRCLVSFNEWRLDAAYCLEQF